VGNTHIPSLDAHLFSTVGHHPSLQASLNRGDVLEIQGPASSGKTHLLYHLTIVCLSPEYHEGHYIGGWNKAAVIFDCDESFDVIRLEQLFCARLSRLISRSAAIPDSGVGAGGALLHEPNINRLVMNRLAHLHIFRPTTSLQLAATLLNLPSYHVKNDPDVEIGLLAVDSISACYWPDRFTVEQLRLGENLASKDVGSLNPLHPILKALQRFRLSHGVITVLTNWGLHSLSSASGTSPFYRQHLHPFPAPFMTPDSAPPQSLMSDLSSFLANRSNDTGGDQSYPSITHQITLSLAPTSPLPPGMAIDQAAEQEKEWRSSAIARGEVVGLVRTPGSQRVGRFVWRIGDKEIVTDTDE
jgi:DNA-repair protein XRCC2